MNDATLLEWAFRGLTAAISFVVAVVWGNTKANTLDIRRMEREFPREYATNQRIDKLEKIIEKYYSRMDERFDELNVTVLKCQGRNCNKE